MLVGHHVPVVPLHGAVCIEGGQDYDLLLVWREGTEVHPAIFVVPAVDPGVADEERRVEDVQLGILVAGVQVMVLPARYFGPNNERSDLLDRREIRQPSKRPRVEEDQVVLVASIPEGDRKEVVDVRHVSGPFLDHVGWSIRYETKFSVMLYLSAYQLQYRAYLLLVGPIFTHDLLHFFLQWVLCLLAVAQVALRQGFVDVCPCLRVVFVDVQERKLHPGHFHVEACPVIIQAPHHRLLLQGRNVVVLGNHFLDVVAEVANHEGGVSVFLLDVEMQVPLRVDMIAYEFREADPHLRVQDGVVVLDDEVRYPGQAWGRERELVFDDAAFADVGK